MADLNKEEQELNELLSTPPEQVSKRSDNREEAKCAPEPEPEMTERAAKRTLVQWTTNDKKVFIPSTYSTPKLEPGLYEINHSNACGIYFTRVGLGTEGLIRFKETNSDEVVKEIETFWERETLFEKFNLAFKRGILLWGPPGSGKTGTVKLVIEDIIKRKGVVIKFCHPDRFVKGVRSFREIEPDTPCVIIMEDLDSILEVYNESEVINILDGVDMINKVVYIATTNYPTKLGARIVNRPSRFDKRIKIGKPNAESRRTYFEHLFSANGQELREKHDIEKWIEDTDDLSIAHLKELFISLVILGKDYDETITRLKNMKDQLDEIHDGRSAGFQQSKPAGFLPSKSHSSSS